MKYFLSIALLVGFALTQISRADQAAAPPAPEASSCTKHAGHNHKHGKNCGHKAVRHQDHFDYLHDGHKHAMHDGHVDEH